MDCGFSSRKSKVGVACRQKPVSSDTAIENASKVEFSRNVYEGDSDEEITLYRQSDHQHSETGIGRNANS